MIKMRAGYLQPNGWKHNIDDQENNLCTDHFIFQIQQKCKYVSIALNILLNKNSNTNIKYTTWDACCQLAIQQIDELQQRDID